ncbi:MAG: response regulator transcription factor [Caldilineaceae bacterium]|nr:response regulator transcription factor [Caldilineaceae bacterium]MCB9138015.1 response regulator transcription factor [Caldilineaceae bacterium]
MNKQKILVVDDEPQTRKYIGANLLARGFCVLKAEDGRSALKLFEEEIIDLVILDIMMPGMNGFEVCEAIRRISDTPVIILSARGQEKDIVRALNIGADDYLTKPFGVGELLARVCAVLRRTAAQGPAAPRRPYEVDGLCIDFAAKTVTLNREAVPLTPTEYNLLAHLAVNAGRVLSHSALLQSVWGPEYGGENEYLWAYVRRLRRKIEADPSKPHYIRTQPGFGYSLIA